MRTSRNESETCRGLDDLTELYRDGLKRPDRAELDRGLDGVRTRIAARIAHRRRAVRWSLTGVGAALLLVSIAYTTALTRRASPTPEPPALAYQIEGGTILKGGYLRESGHVGIKVHFSEGTQIAFTPGARGRIRSVDKDSTRVAVDHGKAAFHVHKTEGRRWLVEVGPFLITVKGTIFTTSWDPVGEQFELTLRRGLVAVSGPASTGEINLEAGQRLVVNLARAETIISEARPGDSDDESPAPPTQPAAEPVAPQARPVTSPRRPVSQPSRPSSAPAAGNTTGGRWAEDFAQGRWDRILKDAESSGIETTLNKASLDDLFVLADAARYRHRLELARAALLAERRRFPNSPRTLAATFLLGRVEESSDGGRTQAIAWYDEYLSRAPTGTLAAEALGRKMMLTAGVDGPARARPIAEDYLRRFPNGSYARAARLLQAQPAPRAP